MDDPISRLKRIEAKLDEILRRLDESEVARATARLRKSTDRLAAAAAAAGGPPGPKESAMADSVPVIDALVQQVAQTATVIDSAVTLITGINDRIAAAVRQALAGGATADQLKPLTDLNTQVGAETQKLADAVAANTPAPQSKK